MLGLSTGARGVILIGIKTDTLFTKGAALSGDYNQTRLPNDNLVRGYYGQYSKFKKRWEDIDNPTRQSKNIKFDLYLGHGKIDKVVDYSQTTELYDSVRKNNRSINVKLSIQSKMGHNFSYWRSEVNNVLMFFEK
jgi:dipeptidyl aminopeptidase/acylaminoacyl peptidase